MIFPYRIGFIGVGHMGQALIKGLLQSQVVQPGQIFASNRSPGKLQKVVESWSIVGLPTNEQVIEAVDIVILSMKPQDFSSAVDPLISLFGEKQIVISLAAGITLANLEKKIPQSRIVRVMPNTPTVIQKGVIGYLLPSPSGGAIDLGLKTTVEDLLSHLGVVIQVQDEEQFEALMIACSSGVGFIFEIMSYFQEWIEERGFDPLVARKMVIETFLGTSLLALNNKDLSLEDLQFKVVSKKGVTATGLDSMRELEIERALRISFEKASLRNQELAKQG